MSLSWESVPLVPARSDASSGGLDKKNLKKSEEKQMKKFRKLIPALCMLLVSALFVGTSTYAWFSMNKEVTATNMQVTAKSDNIYLQIKQANAEDADYDKKDEAVTAAKDLYPVDYKAINGTNVTWGRTDSNDTGDVKYTAKDALTDVADTTKYVWSDSFKIRVADAKAEAKDLVLSGVKVTGTSEMSEALRVLVVTKEGAMIWANTGAQNNKAAATGVGTPVVVNGNNLAATVTNADPIDVTVYVYFDGNDDSCYTDGIVENFSQLNIELTFSAKAPSEA